MTLALYRHPPHSIPGQDILVLDLNPLFMPDAPAVADQSQPGKSQGDQANANQGREQPSPDSQAEKIKLSNGEELTREELEAGYMRGKDYTTKTQQLAEEKRRLGRGIAPDAPEKKAAPAKKEKPDDGEDDATEIRRRAAEYGLATKEDVDEAVNKRLAKMQAEQDDKSKLDSLIEANPDLKGKRKLLEQIGRTDTRAWEDIAKDPEYGFLPQGSKLEKAHQPGVMGERKAKEKSGGQPDFRSMTPQQFADWEKAQGITGQIPLGRTQKVR